MIRRRKQVSATLLTFLSHSDFECCLLSPPHVPSSGLPSARGPPEALVQNHGETLAVNCELLALPDPAAWVPDEKSRKGCPGPGSQEAMLQRPRALRLPSHPLCSEPEHRPACLASGGDGFLSRPWSAFPVVSGPRWRT